MKKSVFHVLFILIIVLSIFISCKSAPPKVAEGQQGTLGYVTAARQRAIDFQCPDYFPSEWEDLENQYNTISSKSPKAEDYNALAASYDELLKKTVPLYAQAKEDEITAAREPLISSGFSQYFPEYLKKADDMALAAQEQYKAGDYYKARDTAAAALKEYEDLQTANKVFLARQQIIDLGFSQYDEENFADADEIVKAAIADYDAGKKEAAFEKAEDALNRYNTVISNGWTAYAADRRAISSKERELAIAERANIASRDSFREAEAVYINAEELFKDGKYDEAAVAFTQAEARFAISRIETEEKRIKAEEAIRMAEERIGVSSETATEAEKIIEGGPR
ncbi:MAG: hypothetical protein FWC22_06565 [Treponema sp.]|nr:hypothetical protein [Treponema sp.]